MAVWSVLCDFDGTISKGDVTDRLLEVFGKPEWRTLEAEWIAGRIGSRECMRRQIACLDASGEELDAVLDGIEIDETFADFADAVRTRGGELSIVSDGLDYAIRRILRRYHLSGLPVYACHLVPDGPRGWRLEFPHADIDCVPASGLCKCAIARRARAMGKKTLLIGDGRSDFCASGHVDFVFAKGLLAEHCAAQQFPHRRVADFADVLSFFPAIPGIN
ncbi:MAG: MtnX-like HAD-IB family phosphatase [Zoogloeaceae bacterium]|nr:MtnX-like HAD-IB family phosphatase [Zoogloeaceae bacterium]